MTNTQIWAHRGASTYAPDNSMPVMQQAFTMGVDAIISNQPGVVRSIMLSL